MSSYLSSFTGLSQAPAPRHLTVTRQLAHTPTAIFNVVNDVASYQHFLPLTTSSQILTRDKANKPEKFSLKVGYPELGIYEAWTCHFVTSDRGKDTVTYARDDASHTSSVLQEWTVTWTIQASKLANPLVKMDLTLRFRSNIYDQMFLLFEAQVAPKIMDAFERRIVEMETRQKVQPKARPQDIKEKEKAALELRKKLVAASKPTLDTSTAAPAAKNAAAPASSTVSTGNAAAKKKPQKLEVRSGKPAT